MSSLTNKHYGSQASHGLAASPSKTVNVDDGLIEYADALEAIDENSPMAVLNATSISDNNGGRILL